MADTPQENGTAALKNFQRFHRLLEADFARHHHVRHYAERLGMSEANLGLACATVAGVSPKRCIARRLVVEAEHLLTNTKLPVQTIAEQLGFDEATNFGKFFRRENGLAPLLFREQTWVES